MKRRMLRHSFWASRFDPGRRLAGAARRIALGEVALGTFAIVVLGGALVVQNLWLSRASADVAVVEARAKVTSLERVRLEEMLARAREAKDAIVYAEWIRRSGPVLARRIAALAGYIPPDVSASSLDAMAAAWSLNGHASSYAQLGSILETLDGQALAPVLSGSQMDGMRVKFAVALGGLPSTNAR